LPDLLADSYAFIELYGGNPRYRDAFRSNAVGTTSLNVLEVYGALLRRIDRPTALTLARSMLPVVVDVPRETALRAAEFRLEMVGKKRNCSHVDAWGYASAETLGRRFLTGDESFRGLPNVEFVK
jgi:hypothetical protein